MSKLLKASVNRVEIGRAPRRYVQSGKKAAPYGDMPTKKRFAFAVTPRFFLFLLLWYAGRVFTQALRSPLSAIFYVFLFLLPVFSLIYLVFARGAVRVFLGRGKGEGQKQTPVDFDMRIINDSPLPLTFVEADLMVPDEKRVRCRTKRVRMMLLPHGYCDLAQSLVFPYRGEYEIGVSDVYVYDYFRLFRLRKRLSTFMTVYIMPRKVVMEESAHFSNSDVDTENVRNIFGADRAEIKEIRNYIPGDHMKTIHWKLSTKSEELMVKEYSHHAGNTVYVFADMAQIHSGHYQVDEEWMYEDDVNEYVADGVVETAAALVDCALRSDHRCEILWFDSRIPGGVHRFPMESYGEGSRYFRHLATAGIMPESCNVTRLTDLVDGDQGVSYLFVTGRIDNSVAKGISALAAGTGADSVSLYFINPESRVTQPEQHKRYTDMVRRNRQYLQSRGVRVTEPEHLMKDQAANDEPAPEAESEKGEAK